MINATVNINFSFLFFSIIANVKHDMHDIIYIRNSMINVYSLHKVK